MSARTVLPSANHANNSCWRRGAPTPRTPGGGFTDPRGQSVLRSAAYALVAALALVGPPRAPAADHGAFIQRYCAGCHDAVERKGGLDLDSLAFAPNDAANFRQWARVYDRVESGEMPPREKPRPDAADLGGEHRTPAQFA